MAGTFGLTIASLMQVCHLSPTAKELTMNPQTQGTEQQGPSGVPFVNDPAKPANAKVLNDPFNEDPGSEMDDATVPLIEDDDQE